MAKKEPSKLSRNIDVLCQRIFLTEEGRPKSASLLYSFCLGILFLFVYVGTYMGLLPDFQTLLPSLPTICIQILEYLFIAIVGTLPAACLVYFLKRNYRQIPAAFTWICIFDALMLLAILVMIDWAEGFLSGLYMLWVMMLAVGFPILLPTVFGTVIVNLIYRKKEQEEAAKMPKRPSYYNT